MDRDVIYRVAGAVGLGAAAAALFILGKKLYYRCRKNPYESEKMVEEYLGFHYCSPEEYLPHAISPKDALDFPLRCAQLCLKHKPEGVISRAYDIGCAVGRSSFELAREFDEVVGLDYSYGFIAKCQKLKLTGMSDYKMTTEGDLEEKMVAKVDPAIDRSRVHFTVGSACDLPDLGKFGCVFAGNLICRLPEPRKFFDRLAGIVVPGGILIITSPYTWLKQYTPKSKWIGGYTKGGVEVTGLMALEQFLDADFELIDKVDMPFLIRETVRKYQWTVAHATVWKRR